MITLFYSILENFSWYFHLFEIYSHFYFSHYFMIGYSMTIYFSLLWKNCCWLFFQFNTLKKKISSLNICPSLGKLLLKLFPTLRKIIFSSFFVNHLKIFSEIFQSLGKVDFFFVYQLKIFSENFQSLGNLFTFSLKLCSQRQCGVWRGV